MESGGAWLLRWKLPWSFACLRHQRFLSNDCAGCATRIARGSTHPMKPLSPAQMPDPLRCRNPRPGSRHTRWEPACGLPVEALRKIYRANWSLRLKTQAVLDATLASELAAAKGQQGYTANDYFSDMRALCILAFTWGATEQFGAVHPRIKQVFAEYAANRDQIGDPTPNGARVPEATRKAPRHHFVPTTPLLWPQRPPSPPTRSKKSP